jgi:hypothetical protein
VRVRPLGLLLAAALVMGVAACGSDENPSKAAPGSPENPLVAKQPRSSGITSESGAKPPAPGYTRLLEQQRKVPVERDRNNPCALVTKAQAEAILGAKLVDPVVRPQGPTCIYRDSSSQRFAAISVQTQSFAALRRQLRRAERVDVSGRTAYCGMHGRPMLYMPLSGGRVLSVAAQCDAAARFARRAGARLLT